MVVRKVVTRSGRRVRGYFPSRKMDRMIAWESQLERDAIFLFEFSPGVLQYREQPERIYFSHCGVTHLYIPDFELELATGQTIHIEVKPFKKLADVEIASRFEAIRLHYSRGDRGFQILTEKEIRNEDRLENLRLLSYHAGRLTRATSQALADRLGFHNMETTVATAAVVLGDVLSVYRLLGSGRYRCDLDLPITSNTKIYPVTKGEHHASLLF